MSDIVLEVIRAAILLYVVLYLVKAGKKRKELCRKGWGFVVAGFGLLLFGNIMDITDNFESLNRFIVIGDTPTEAFLEKMVGFMGGFAMLAIGLIRWIPTITGVHRTKQLNEELEQEITGRKRTEEALRTSEDKYKSMFENMVPGSCFDELIYKDGIATDYRILDVNPSCEKILGIPRSEVIGKLASEVYKTDKVPFVDIYARVAETGISESYEVFFPPANKLLAFTITCPGKGKFSSMFLDITELKQAEEMLRSSEHQLNAMFNSSPVGMMLINENTEVARINAYLTDMTGKNSEELLGLQPGEIFNCANAHNDKGGCGKGEACGACPVRGAVTKVLETGRPIYNAEVIMHLLTDGHIKNAWLSFSLVQIEIEERRHVMTAFVDITERKQAEKETKKLIADMERMNRLMTGREMRVIEMKKEVNALLAELGRQPEYKSVLEDAETVISSDKAG